MAYRVAAEVSAVRDVDEKVCRKCGQNQPFSEYYSGSGKFGLNSWCKSCMATAKKTWRKNNLAQYKKVDAAWREKNADRIRRQARASWLRRYGLTPETYTDILTLQGGGCAVCGREESLCVDHNHETGEVRGILCRKCNLAIGHLNDDYSLIESALRYMEKFEC